MAIKTPSAFKPLYEAIRYKVYWGGRGAAKSTAFADALIMMGSLRQLRILCTREKQNSIKESVHALLKSRIDASGIQGYEVTNTEIRHKNGTKFFFMGLWNNIDSIKSVADVDICWVEEANTVSEASWDKLIPTIRKPGSEIWVSFNPELKSDACYQRFVLNPPPNAHVQKVSWRDNPWFTQEMAAEKDHLFKIDPELARHVWEGELKQFADGAVFAVQLKMAEEQGRITSIPIHPSKEVHTFWDLGRNDSTAIWFMQENGEYHDFVDYYEMANASLDHYIKILKEKDYNWGRHYLPHDVTVEDLSSNRGSRKDILEHGGVRPIKVVPRIQSIEEGIEKARQAFYKCRFDKDRCSRGLDALSNYQYKWNDDANTFGLKPLHNWASNGSDAYRQYAQGFKSRKHFDTSMYQPDQRFFE